jgi:hypothetical protein
LLERVRETCSAVARSAALVEIDRGRLEEYALDLPLREIDEPTLDPAHHHLGGDDDATAAFVLALDAVNFGSGWFPHLRKRPGMSGYFTVATSLKERFDREGPMAADELAGISQETCAALFGQPVDGPAGELMGLFAQAWNDLGGLLLGEYDGRPAALVEATGRSAAALVGLLDRLPFFHDVATYRGRDVLFYKRAQITAADLSLAFGGEGLGRFDDLDRLTIFADNLVPHVLRVDGVLTYERSLAARIDGEELLSAGSDEEVEIRASAVHAVELMVGVLRDAGQDATAMGLDYLLWNRGQAARYKAALRHRTRTVFY